MEKDEGVEVRDERRRGATMVFGEALK